MTRKRNWQSLAPAIALAMLCATAAPAVADDGFHIWVDPVDLWVLENDVDTNSSKYQEYRDMSSGLWLGMKVYGESEDGDRTLAIRLSGVGREDARYSLDYGLSGKYSLAFDYNQIPHLFGNGGTLLWDMPAPNRFEFPDPVQEAVLGAILDQRGAGGSVNFDFLSQVLAPYYATANRIDLGLRRDRSQARFDLGRMGRMAWAIEYRQENRNGNRPVGAAFGFNNVQEVAEPINYTTRDTEISGEFNGKKSGLRFGYRYSTFDNEFDSFTWDNIFRSFDSTNSIAYLGPNTTPEGPSQGLTSLAPENEASMFFLDGRGKAGSWWYNGNLVYNKMTQDQALLPFTINTAIVGMDEDGGPEFNAATAGLPITNADTEATVLNFSANAGTTFAEDFSFVVRYRYYDYDNGSPRVDFPGYVRLDSVWEPPALVTVPMDYTRDNFSVELGWDVSKTTQLALEYELQNWDRNFREVADAEDETITLSVDSRPNDKTSVRASWATGDRSTSEYFTEAQEVFFRHPHGINNQPGLRKYDEAVRDVDDYDLAVQFFPKPEWSLSFGLSGREEDYPESEFGLVSDEYLNYNFEIGYVPGENLNFYLFAHSSDREVFQRGRQSGGSLSTNPLDDWSVLLNEDTATWGLGVNGKTDKGWTFDLSAHMSDSDGEGDFTTPAGGRDVVDIANYEDIELTQVWLNVGYEVSQLCSVGVFYLFEDYTIDSFILTGLVPYLPQSILLAANEGNYEANLFGVNLRLKF